MLDEAFDPSAYTLSYAREVDLSPFLWLLDYLKIGSWVVMWCGPVKVKRARDAPKALASQQILLGTVRHAACDIVMEILHPVLKPQP